MLQKISNNLARLSGNWICRLRGNPFAEALVRSTNAFLNHAENVNFNLENNGELRVLECLSSIEPKVIFDVGANRGDWTEKATSLYPTTQIHTFEPVIPTFNQLRKKFASNPTILLNQFGLSDREEKIPIYLSNKGSSDATAFKIPEFKQHDAHYTHSVECHFKRGVDYIRDNRISTIDFMKIDAEGMDFRVIKGFERDIVKVRALQFEYGIFNISSRDLLYDFHSFLYANDFKIGKIYPNHLDFFEYNCSMENFSGNNFVAVKKDEVKLITALSKI